MDRNFTQKSIFEYDNFRAFLKDVYESAKAQNKKFSFRFFARLAGYKSPDFLQRVMTGKRNLTDAGVNQIALALKLNKNEYLYFRNLVKMNQAKNSEERFQAGQELVRSQAFRKLHPLKESQYNYFAHWYTIPIRDLVGLPGFKEDHEWIGRQLYPHLTPAEVKNVLEELLSLDLIRRNDEGRLVPSQEHVITPDEVGSSSLANTHIEFMKRAAESIDRVPREKRDISAVTISMSVDSMKKIKEKVHKFREELLEMASRESQPNAVYQINFQIFPVIDISKKEED